MEHISNKEKAQEITNKQWEWIADLIEKNNLSKEDRNQIRFKMYGACLDMAEWTKQQLIDRLEDWLANNICNAYNFRGDNISSTFMNDCIEAMKGE